MKDNQKNLYDELDALRKDKIFQDANKYRTAVAHGISENEIHNTILEEKNGIKLGRLSGIVAHFVPKYLQKNRMPSWETNCIEDWETKYSELEKENLFC